MPAQFISPFLAFLRGTRGKYKAIHLCEMSFLAITLLVLAAAIGSCQGELLQVILLHRHGSRTRLGKNGTTLDESASTLTPQGMTGLYRVGSQARARYFIRPSCQSTGTCLYGDWNSFDHRTWSSQSSAVDRTLQSAQAVLLGLLPPTDSTGNNFSDVLGQPGGIQPVPIYSLPVNDDWIIRPFGQQKCPTYLARFKTFFTSDPYCLEKEAEYAGLLQTLSAAFDTQVNLTDVWNYFDAYNVQQEYGADTPAGGPQLPALDAATLAELRAAADFMEWNRYGNSSLVGALCGGLLAQITQDVERGAGALAAVPPSISPGPRLVHYSVHYPTLLCLLSAINLTVADPSQSDPNTWLHKIPEYGALLAIEVHSNAISGLTVRMYMQDGPAAVYRQILLPCGSDGSCTWGSFQSHVEGSLYSTVGQWCDACANTTMTSCAAYKYLQSIGQLPDSSGAHVAPRNAATWRLLPAAAAAAAVLTTLASLL